MAEPASRVIASTPPACCVCPLTARCNPGCPLLLPRFPGPRELLQPDGASCSLVPPPWDAGFARLRLTAVNRAEPGLEPDRRSPSPS